MYITGSQFNFEKRLHQLPTGVIDLDLFELEGLTYTERLATEYKWNKEFEKKSHQIINSGERPF